MFMGKTFFLERQLQLLLINRHLISGAFFYGKFYGFTNPLVISTESDLLSHKLAELDISPRIFYKCFFLIIKQ